MLPPYPYIVRVIGAYAAQGAEGEGGGFIFVA